MDEERNPKRGWQSDTEPLTFVPERMGSKYAESKLEGGDEYADSYGIGEPDTIDAGLAVSPAIDDYLKTGLFNSDFRFGPPRPNEPIDNDSNPLPYWQLGPWHPGGTALTDVRAMWVDSDISRSGKAVRLYVGDDPTAPDDASWGLYQNVPVTGNDMWGHAHANVSAASGTPSTEDYYYLAVTQLDAAGSAINPQATIPLPNGWYVESTDLISQGWGGYAGEYAIGFDFQSRHLGCFSLVNEDAANNPFNLGGYDLSKSKYARVWTGHQQGDFSGGIGGGGGYYRDVHNLTMRRPTIRWATFNVVNNNWSANGSKALYVGGGGDWTTYAFGTGNHIVQYGGCNLGVSTRLLTDRTSGNIETYIWSNSGATGPFTLIYSGNPRNDQAVYPLGYWGQLADWDEGDWERLRGEHYATSWAPTSNENLSHFTLALFDRPDNSGL